MTLEQAKELLNSCTRYELRDHAFGDREVYWEKDGKQLASGYFSGTAAEVSGEDWRFIGQAAYKLSYCGKFIKVERNDETGPDEYQEGVTMPGLTLEGVRKELTGEE